MRTLAQRPKALQQTTSATSTIPPRARLEPSHEVRAAAATVRPGHDFSRIPVHSRTPADVERRDVTIQGAAILELAPRGTTPALPWWRPGTVGEKSVEGGEPNFVDDLLAERAPAENGDGGAAPAAPVPLAPAVVKKAGVDSFAVKWSKPAGAGAANAKLRLDYTAKFKKDANHDPALAEFRQSVMSTWDVTAGPHKGRKGTTAPMHDDNYSRADDLAGHTTADVDFYSNDNPGYDDLDKDDVLDYSFTAEQTIIDTSQANKVIATRGPHTATVTGKDPRTYTGVPRTFS